MATFTSTLPEDLLKQLKVVSDKLSIPKNKIIEKALKIYLEQLNKAEYIQSFKQMKNDKELLNMAEEGMAEYLQQIKEV